MRKNPISLLQEYMVLNKKLVPNYTCIEEKSGTHINLFVVKVECGDLNVTASGKSKKEAKLKSATKMLELLEISTQESMDTSSDFEILGSNSNCSTPDHLIEKNLIENNYISKLQDHAVCRGVHPKYHIESVIGPSHIPTFTMVCTYKEFTEKGEANNKQVAKHLAAKKMYYRVTKYSEELVLTALSLKNEYDENEAV